MERGEGVKGSGDLFKSGIGGFGKTRGSLVHFILFFPSFPGECLGEQGFCANMRGFEMEGRQHKLVLITFV